MHLVQLLLRPLEDLDRQQRQQHQRRQHLEDLELLLQLLPLQHLHQLVLVEARLYLEALEEVLQEQLLVKVQVVPLKILARWARRALCHKSSPQLSMS